MIKPSILLLAAAFAAMSLASPPAKAHAAGPKRFSIETQTLSKAPVALIDHKRHKHRKVYRHRHYEHGKSYRHSHAGKRGHKHFHRHDGYGRHAEHRDHHHRKYGGHSHYNKKHDRHYDSKHHRKDRKDRKRERRKEALKLFGAFLNGVGRH